jgi:hypothetical protein
MPFMAFVSVLVGEHISVTAGRRLLWPLLIAGVGSVLYWQGSEMAGRGDLRPYAIVQFLPMVLIPIIVLLFPSRLSGTGYIWAVLGAYALAKVLEVADGAIFRMLGGVISGHSLKHLVAALGAYVFLIALQRRRLVEIAA